MTTEEKHRGKLEGKVAVITGGRSGIGLATAQWFVSDGAYIFITGRLQSELDAAVELIGKNLIGVQSDVSNPCRSRSVVLHGEEGERPNLIWNYCRKAHPQHISNYLLFYNPRPYMYSRFKSYC